MSNNNRFRQNEKSIESSFIHLHNVIFNLHLIIEQQIDMMTKDSYHHQTANQDKSQMNGIASHLPMSFSLETLNNSHTSTQEMFERYITFDHETEFHNIYTQSNNPYQSKMRLYSIEKLLNSQPPNYTSDKISNYHKDTFYDPYTTRINTPFMPKVYDELLMNNNRTNFGQQSNESHSMNFFQDNSIDEEEIKTINTYSEEYINRSDSTPLTSYQPYSQFYPALLQEESDCQNQSYRMSTNDTELVEEKIILKRFPCNMCSKTFARNYNLINHLNTHHDVRPFSCNICHRRYKSLWLILFIKDSEEHMI